MPSMEGEAACPGGFPLQAPGDPGARPGMVAGRSGARGLRTISTVADDFLFRRWSNRRYLDVVPTSITR
jgi:hypothetical protein